MIAIIDLLECAGDASKEGIEQALCWFIEHDVLERIGQGDAVCASADLRALADEIGECGDVQDFSLTHLDPAFRDVMAEASDLLSHDISQEAERRLRLLLRPKWSSADQCRAEYHASTAGRRFRRWTQLSLFGDPSL